MIFNLVATLSNFKKVPVHLFSTWAFFAVYLDYFEDTWEKDNGIITYDIISISSINSLCKSLM